MIVHEVKIGKPKTDQQLRERHKTIYVSCAGADLKYRDMLVNFRQRWEFYINGKLDFCTSDPDDLKSNQWKQIAEKKICDSDGVMMIVSEHTALDPVAVWEIDCALMNSVSIVGVDIRTKSEGKIPEKLVGKMTRYGWEWFAMFINSL